jgi:hypothetical protein
MIDEKDLREMVTSDAADLGVTDSDSIMILAIMRAAQAALANEVNRMMVDGANAPGIEAYREVRTAQLDRWVALQTEKVRMRRIAREEVERCLG